MVKGLCSKHYRMGKLFSCDPQGAVPRTERRACVSGRADEGVRRAAVFSLLYVKEWRGVIIKRRSDSFTCRRPAEWEHSGASWRLCVREYVGYHISSFPCSGKSSAA